MKLRSVFRLTTTRVISTCFLLVIAVGQFVMRDYLATLELPNSHLDAFFATLGLFKLSLPTSDLFETIPTSVQLIRVLAPLTTATTLVATLQKSVTQTLDLYISQRWKDHHVVIGDSQRALQLAKSRRDMAARGDSNHTVLIADKVDQVAHRDLRRAGVKICNLQRNSSMLRTVIRKARSAVVDMSDDDTSVEWGMHILSLFQSDPANAPQKVTIYVSSPELTRLETVIPYENVHIIAKDARFAADLLHFERPVRGARGPLNLLVVADDPGVVDLLNAMWQQHIRVGERAHITLVGPLTMEQMGHRCELPPSMVHFEFQPDLSDAEAVALRIESLLDSQDLRDFGNVSSTIYIWTRQMGIDALLATFLIQRVNKRIVIVAKSEISRNFSVLPMTGRNSSGVISVVTAEFLMRNGILGIVPDQELLALGLHSYHGILTKGPAEVVGASPVFNFRCELWQASSSRHRYFELATSCLQALKSAGVRIEPSRDRSPQLSSHTLIRSARALAATLGRPFDVTDDSPQEVSDRYAIIDLVAQLPMMLGGGYSIVETTPGVILDESQVAVIAADIHTKYHEAESPRANTSSATVSVDALTEWEQLRPRMKDSNIDQARSIPLKLATMGLVLYPDESSTKSWNSDTLNLTVIDALARVEHQRWCTEMFARDYKAGTQRDDTRLEHPDLRPYEDLEQESQEKDRRTIRNISSHLHTVGLTARKLQETTKGTSASTSA
jgi:hypothetical protein